MLDGVGGLVPVGVVGELWVGGRGVARGYVNRPELTAERFVEREIDGRWLRLYRTGDLVRWLPHGELEYVGRSDDQVKIRGYRIELGEIESVLSAHDAVSSCAVIVREDEPGDKRLVAYCVSTNGTDVSTLRAWCARSLPGYMVPAAFVFLDTLPLTANGKTNRRALPKPVMERHGLGGLVVRPRSELEGVVAAVWSDVLGINELGVHDNFFEIGGHSLLATRVVNRLTAVLERRVTVRDLFESPTVAGLTRTLNAGTATRYAPIVARSASNESTPLSFGQQRIWFLDRLHPNSTEYLLSHALRIRGDEFDAIRLERALNQLVERHESLRTVIRQSPEGISHQVVLDQVHIALEVLASTDSELLGMLVEESSRPMDLSCGPLFRAVLVRLSDADHVLLLVTHHAVSDGWSVGVLMRELGTLYGGSAVADVQLQYRDFALWQREWVGDGSGEQLEYWCRQLAGVAPLELPTDRVRPRVRSGRGSGVNLVIEDGAAVARAVARATDVTSFMVLLAVFDVLMARWSGQSDIAVGTPVANRSQVETEDLVGFFVNTLVLRADMTGDPSFRELLARVRRTAIGAYSHQDVPFERVVEEIAPDRALDRTPLFQVMFIQQNAAQDRWHLPGLDVDELDFETTTSKFDLTLSVREQGNDLLVHLEYATDLFDAATMHRMAGHYQVLLESLSADPDTRVFRAPVLTDDEHEQLQRWNDTYTTIPEQLTVAGLVERWVQATPDAVAVVCGEQSLTYRELDARANQLARV
ncbi:MAG: condensation domain-containing protein, partial [Pseudonocardiaceae bacterium]